MMKSSNGMVGVKSMERSMQRGAGAQFQIQLQNVKMRGGNLEMKSPRKGMM